MDKQQNYKELGCAVTIRAMKDFFAAVNEAQKKKILKELKSDWMDWISFGLSTKLAEVLENNPERAEKIYTEYEGRCQNG